MVRPIHLRILKVKAGHWPAELKRNSLLSYIQNPKIKDLIGIYDQ